LTPDPVLSKGKLLKIRGGFPATYEADPRLIAAARSADKMSGEVKARGTAIGVRTAAIMRDSVVDDKRSTMFRIKGTAPDHTEPGGGAPGFFTAS
jgi:hypothetical protein